MHEDDFEVVHGSGNVFRDLGLPDAEVLQVKATLAAAIIGVLNDEGISVQEAQARTGYSAALFSRARRGKIRGVTLDRLIDMLSKLGHEVELSVSFRPRAATPLVPTTG